MSHYLMYPFVWGVTMLALYIPSRLALLFIEDVILIKVNGRFGEIWRYGGERYDAMRQAKSVLFWASRLAIALVFTALLGYDVASENVILILVAIFPFSFALASPVMRFWLGLRGD